MEQNAHEQMKKNTPILPETISDQIRIWESERNRIRYDPGVLYDTFPSQSVFEKVLKYSQDIGVHIWSNKQKQLLMVTQEGHELVKPFIKKNVST